MRVYSIAPGSTRTPSSPRKDPTQAAALLLLVRTANRCGPDRAADHTGHRDHGQDVRERVEQRAGGGAVSVREPLGERAREAEQERRRRRSERPPLAEDQRGERDEAPADGHVLVEGADEADREVR